MEEKIKEVQMYLKNKLLDGEFNVVEITEFVAEVRIDAKYSFFIWIGNWDYPKYFKLSRREMNFMYFELTDNEAVILSEILIPLIDVARFYILVNLKKEKIAELEKQIELL